ncbi:MAG: YfhO family protein [Lachnospiraceae bacterium]|nr:YfhO family protein [Lachnospiraceae bacterium]
MSDKKNRLCLYLLSFFIPIILLLAAFFIHGIYPFGDNTVMTGDMEYQFVDYLAYLKTIITGNNDFSYSFSKNLGGSMAGFSAYYYYTPLNFITLFFPNTLLPVAESVVIVLTAALSSLTMAILLAEKYEADARSVLFSVAYALCGFSATYFQLTMYSGNLILFPLIILGLLNIIEKPGNNMLYLVTLVLAVLFNYYSGYMICIFSLLFFISEEVIRGFDKKACISFIGSSLLGVLLTAFNLVPAVLSLRGEKNSFSFGIFRTFSLSRLPLQLLPCSFDGNVSTGLPNIYCGVLTVIFFVIYILYKKFPVKERLVMLLLCAFLVLNFWINVLNIVWHGFNQPIGFPYRYSYMFSFLMIIGAHRTYKELFTGSGKLLVIVPVILIILQLGDLTWNYQDVMNYYGLSSLSEYQKYLTDTNEKLNVCREDNRASYNENELYRIEKYFRRTNNDAMQFNYAGLSHFSSSEKKDKINFMGKLGFRNNGNWSFYNESSTDFVESFLGVRYILSQFATTPNFYNNIFSNEEEETYIFRNENALPLMFNTTEAIRDINYNGYNGNPFMLQEALASSLNGKENRIFEEAEILSVELDNLKKKAVDGSTIYEKIDPDRDASINIRIKIKDHQQNLFAYFDSDLVQNAEIFKDDVSYGEYFTRYRWNIVSFHRSKKKVERVIRIRPKDERLDIKNMFFYFEDRDKVEALMNEVRENPSELEKITSSHLKGRITVPDYGGTVTLTIPYDRGWTIYVDGVKAEQKKAAGILMSFDAAPGEHNIEMKYCPTGSIAGKIISIFAFFILLGMLYFRRKSVEK